MAKGRVRGLHRPRRPPPRRRAHREDEGSSGGSTASTRFYTYERHEPGRRALRRPHAVRVVSRSSPKRVSCSSRARAHRSAVRRSATSSSATTASTTCAARTGRRRRRWAASSTSRSARSRTRSCSTSSRREPVCKTCNLDPLNMLTEELRAFDDGDVRRRLGRSDVAVGHRRETPPCTTILEKFGVSVSAQDSRPARRSIPLRVV